MPERHHNIIQRIVSKR